MDHLDEVLEGRLFRRLDPFAEQYARDQWRYLKRQGPRPQHGDYGDNRGYVVPDSLAQQIRLKLAQHS
jgi:hypothetical protein